MAQSTIQKKFRPTWIWGDIGNYYGTGTNAFTCYDNLFRITFKSPKEVGEKTELICSNYPKTEGLEIVNEVVASDDKRDLAYVFGSLLDKKPGHSWNDSKRQKNFHD
jgi:serine-type D-Ala-D-Ala carboxypeptidase/endopeptidase (penicillin-binding protein 4)